MDTLETLLAASTPTLESLEDEHGNVPVAASSMLPGDMSSAPFAPPYEDASSVDDVCERIDRSIYAALVAS
jgi:hypothetical protein